ncbi:MAG: hypothetical protein WC758_08505 [Candidatus Woesearchaeota archaeon]|jgi:hypothetical protein
MKENTNRCMTCNREINGLIPCSCNDQKNNIWDVRVRRIERERNRRRRYQKIKGVINGK